VLLFDFAMFNGNTFSSRRSHRERFPRMSFCQHASRFRFKNECVLAVDVVRSATHVQRSGSRALKHETLHVAPREAPHARARIMYSGTVMH